MDFSTYLPLRSPLAEYELQAQALFQALNAGNEEGRWMFKWEHPRYRGKGVEAVIPSELSLDDARLIIARKYAFNTWDDLAGFASAIDRDAELARFENAVDLVVDGKLDELAKLLAAFPNLVHVRSTRRHHASLLHYIGANGVENYRQRTPKNAVEVTKLLLDRGAEVDSLADMYNANCTTMSMLLSSCHPANAGLQVPLAETLLDYGAAIDGPGTNWSSSVMTALTFGYLPAAQALYRRGAKIESVFIAAGLGLVDKVKQLYPAANPLDRQKALALAAQHGQTEVAAYLLAQGEDPNRFNPEGMHGHSTPLHQAICAGRLEVVRLLVEGGADLELRDTLYHGTALGWAEHCEQPEIAAYLAGLKSKAG